MLICGYDELDSGEEAEVTKKKDKDAKYKWNRGRKYLIVLAKIILWLCQKCSCRHHCRYLSGKTVHGATRNVGIFHEVRDLTRLLL